MTGSRSGPLSTRALERESDRAQRFLAGGEWRPTDADADAAAGVLARLTAPLPVRGAAGARARAEDRDRRLQRIWRSAVHHLDAGAVSPQATALLAAVARVYLPWYASPTPPTAAAAPRYPSHQAVPPTEAGEDLLPGLTALFAALAAPRPPGTAALTPPAVPWQARYAGRFRHYGRPARDVWTADTFHCPGCARADGPWSVACDWRRIALGCPCGVVTGEHGLRFSEVWLLLPDA
ncbi:hypothetical protein ACFZAU_00200 [Streptomyces sp. NPDC008238]